MRLRPFLRNKREVLNFLQLTKLTELSTGANINSRKAFLESSSLAPAADVGGFKGLSLMEVVVL